MAKATITDLFREQTTSNKRLFISLPIPPSVNHMYANTRYGGKRLTRDAEAYIPVSRAIINLAMEEQRWIKPPRQTWLYLDCVFYMPDRKIRDSHNCLKMLLDVLQDNVYENDYWVMPRINAVEYDKLNPRVEILVTLQNNSARNKGVFTSTK